MVTFADSTEVFKRRLSTGALPLSNRWSGAEIEAACQAESYRWRDRFWTPLRTVWTFLIQVLHVGSSCREAVAIVLSHRAATGGGPTISADPSAYGAARGRLPLEVIRRGVRSVGQALREEVGQTIRWCDRRVCVVDGSSCSMPDTPDLQAAFGQPDGQAQGCGFPVAKIVALFCWASGALLEAATGPWWMSELSLWRGLWHLLAPGDVIVADRFYCNYADMAGLLELGCDSVFRLHHRRRADFRQGKALGRQDRLVCWRRPVCSARPRGMSRREWGRLPRQLTMRLIRVQTGVRGFRSRTIHVATTLLDPVAYPREQIAALYRDRWLVELRLRDIKTTLGMDVLRGRSADVVRKEIYMHLLAYNLIRGLMWEAASAHGAPLHRLSFAGTVDRLNAVMAYLWLYGDGPMAKKLLALLLEWIATDPNPRRPNRVEPRAVKRRPKGYARLNKPRDQARKELRA